MIERFLKAERLDSLKNSLLAGESTLLEALWNGAKAFYIAYSMVATQKRILIITGEGQADHRFFENLTFFLPTELKNRVIEFPAWETLPSENIAPSPDIVGARYDALKKVTESTLPCVLISTPHAALQRLILPEAFKKFSLELKEGQEIGFEALIQNLSKMGFQKKALTADKGEFSVRGGIIDLFPVSSPDPFRIEFWGDTIDSIRIFDPIGQKSIRKVEGFSILPAQELEFLETEQSLGTLFDYLGSETLVVYDDLLALENRFTELATQIPQKNLSVLTVEEFFSLLQPLQKIFYTQEPIETLSQIKILKKARQNFYAREITPLEFEWMNDSFEANRFRSPLEKVETFFLPEEDIKEDTLFKAVSEAAIQTMVVASSLAEKQSLEKKWSEGTLALPKDCTLVQGTVTTGFVFPEEKFVLVSLAEVTGRYKVRRQQQRSSYQRSPVEVFDLTPGDLVVHVQHGIGKFIGIEKKPNNMGIPSEFFTVEYAENGKLFVPIQQSSLVTKYIGSDDRPPSLNIIGSSKWKKAKEQTEKAVQKFAKELLEIYAKRHIVGGFEFSEDSEDMKAFEEEFPYVETEDQLAAIAAIKEDMMKAQAMDRLICGDVGYGKTEVAMRAAFKAVLDGGKQVAVLVPTTVLAMQHYENFVERMRFFPVNIGVVSRFRTPKECRDTLEKVAKGEIDILIGTHRIISQDVIFKNLGLVIIDEEQRFGVKAKEHLKKLKVGVDCLTLSATPIPRTLYMSLVGARDMSVINTPPQDRLPIKTIIAESSDQTFKNALLRELMRDGQAYIIHNRVDTIHELANRIKEQLPQARIVVGHGQMHSDEIDTVFHAFKSGEADILIATTIVESGIDIPNANTILIDRSDQFGLADLYQLRGRVGRWNRRAYAYFLVRNERVLPELARKRLQALMDASGYGGGMRLAMRDLEIRGAGDLLGTEQSGHVSQIGFHFYCKLLKRTIKALQGDQASYYSIETKLEVPYDARIPDTFVSDVALRFEFYQRLGESTSVAEIEELFKEIIDRFGKPPEEVLWLFVLSKIKVIAASKRILTIKIDKFSINFEIQEGDKTRWKKIPCQLLKAPKEFEKKVISLLP